MVLGDKFEYKFSFSQEDVNAFATVTGDNNPIHIDEDKAAQSIFRKRIMHGFLGGSIFSRVFGTIWPGNGTIYLKQNMSFLKPMYVNNEYIAHFKVVEILSKNRFLISTTILNADNDKTIEVDAIIKFDG